MGHLAVGCHQECLRGLGRGHPQRRRCRVCAAFQQVRNDGQNTGQFGFVVCRETTLARPAIQHQGAQQAPAAAAQYRLDAIAQALWAPDVLVQRRRKKLGPVQRCRAKHAHGHALQLAKGRHGLAFAPVVKFVEVVARHLGVDRAFKKITFQVTVFVGPVQQVAQRRHHVVQRLQQGRGQNLGRQLCGAQGIQAGGRVDPAHRRLETAVGPTRACRRAPCPRTECITLICSETSVPEHWARFLHGQG